MLLGGHELAPRNDTNDREVDGDINHCHRDDADDHRALNCAARLLTLVADETDIVIAKVVDAHASRRSPRLENAAQREVMKTGKNAQRGRWSGRKNPRDDLRERRKDR